MIANVFACPKAIRLIQRQLFNIGWLSEARTKEHLRIHVPTARVVTEAMVRYAVQDAAGRLNTLISFEALDGQA